MSEKKEKIIDYFFLQHGLSVVTVDCKQQWGPFVDSLKKSLGTNYIIKYCESNAPKGKTCDGAEIGSLRLANEICEDLKDTQTKRGTEEKYRLHFIGHSMGGIFMRIAVYILFKRGIFDNPNYIPFSYVSLEAPHCGVRKPNDSGVFDSIYKNLSGVLFDGQTIVDLTLNDRPYPPYDPTCLDEIPLMLRICEDEYIDVLRKFKHLTLVQNIRFSFQVPYVSAAIDRALPYSRELMKDNFLMEAFDFDEKYRDIIDNCDKHYELQPEKGEIFEERVDGCVVHERIISQLNTLPWRRINVHFRTKSADAHLFIMGDMRRSKLFKNWRNEDTDLYLADLCGLIKRDIDIDNGVFVETEKNETNEVNEVNEVQQEQVKQVEQQNEVENQQVDASKSPKVTEATDDLA